MTAIIRFEPIYGIEEEEPLCYLLEVDEFTFLLDCGWNTLWNTELVEPLRK